MTSKLVPANPSAVTVIRAISPNITVFSAPFKRFGHGKVGSRGTVVRLSSGSLAVFSPTALTPEARDTIAQLGNKVAYITALDYEHHIFLGPWSKAYPEAKVIGVEGLPEKRAKMDVDQVPFATVFTEANRATTSIGADFDADFEYEYMAGHAGKDIVFYYKPERTLIEADVLFNLPATEQYSRTGEPADTGFFTKLFMILQSAQGTAMGQQRLLWYAIAKDKTSFARSAERINAWDFQRIIPCHGDVIEDDAKGIFRKVYNWHLGKKNV